MRGRGRVVCIDLMGGICIGEKEIHLQFGLTCSRNFLVKLQYIGNILQYIFIYCMPKSTVIYLLEEEKSSNK
jgi:hypothetical protein